jgi:hypothetical protein
MAGPISPIQQQPVTDSEPKAVTPKRPASRRPTVSKAVLHEVPKAPPRKSTVSVTVATQRSGTKLLGDCLNAGVKVRSLGEVFHQDASPVYSFASYLLRQPTLVQDIGLGRTWELLDRYTLELSRIAPYIHFDLMYGNLSYLAPLWFSRSTGLPMVDYLISRDVSVLHLVRDPVDTYVSSIVARCTAVYHSTVESGYAKAKIPVSSIKQAMLAEPFSEYLDQTMRSREAVKRSLMGYPHVLELDYAQLLGRDGFLVRDVRESLASLLTNGDDPQWLQVRPTDIRRPKVDPEIYQHVRDLVDERA